MEKKGVKNVPISGIDDKRSITALFSIILEEKFLPMQMIYEGKTMLSLPKIKFPERVSLSVNESHYSNEKESFKLLEEIILFYIKRTRESLDVASCYQKHFWFMALVAKQPKVS